MASAHKPEMPLDPAGGLGRTVGRVVPATLVVQACSFASSVALASYLGATYATDAYFVAAAVPLLVYGTLLAALRTGAVPALDGRRDDEQGFQRATGELLSAVVLLSVAFAALATVGALLAAPWLLGDADQPSLPLVRSMLVQLAPLGVLGAVIGVLGAILTVRGRAAAPVLVLGLDPLARTVMVVLAGKQLGPTALVLGNLGGSCLAVLVLAVLLLRHENVRPRLIARVRSPFVLEVLAISAPLIVGACFLQLNPLINRSFAAGLGDGAVTVLELGFQIFSIPVTLLGSVLIAPIAAAWSARYRQRGWSAVTQSLAGAVSMLLVVLPPLVVLGLLLRFELVTGLFGGGAFTRADVEQTASVLGILLLGLPAHVFVVPLSTLFLVRRNATFPMQVAMLNVASTVVLILLFRPRLGLEGIALASSLTVTFLSLVYLAVGRRRYGSLGLGAVWPTLARALASAAVLATVVPVLLRVLPVRDGRFEHLAAVVAVGLAGLVIHLVVLVVGREPQVIVLAQRLRPSSTGSRS